MNKKPQRIDLFRSPSLDPTHGIKKQLRLALADSPLSRAEIADRMNEIAVSEGMRTSISKATVDSWLKDSDPGRLPSLPWLTIFCAVLKSTAPLQAMASPLGAEVIGQKEIRVLEWGLAELRKMSSIEEAKKAFSMIGGKGVNYGYGFNEGNSESLEK